MKKTLKKAILLLLTATFVCSSFAGCNFFNFGEKKDGTIANEKLSGGRQEIVSTTNDYIVNKCETDYKIVVSDEAPEIVLFAVNEFNYFFEESTGLTLEIVKDDNLTFSENSKYISFGDNALSAQAKVNYALGEYDGFVVKTVNKSVFIDGDNYGTLYGAYKALYYLVDYEYFLTDAYNLRKNASEVKLLDFNVVQFPDFKIRNGSWGTMKVTTQNMNRMMLTTESNDILIGRGGHNSMDYIPTSIYLNPQDMDNYHPEWYMKGSNNPTQLCYTARGNAEDREAMVQACFETLKVEMIDTPNGMYANFSMSDDRNLCSCDACEESKLKYGTPVAVVIQFLNRLAEVAYEWFETEEGKPYARDLYIYFYAYYTLEVAPAKYNAETGEYYPIDDSVVCNPHVIPQLALTNANYVQDVSTGDMNAAARVSIESWQVCCDNIWAYMYNTNFLHYLVPHNTFSAMQDWYRTYKEAGATYMFNQGKSNEYGMATGWGNLKIYLDTRLVWNVETDCAALIDNFFESMYLDGADEMRKIFDEYRVNTQYHAEVNKKEFLTMNINGNNITKAKFWPLNKLNEWRALVGDALEEIEYLKDVDPVKYASVHKYITTERIWIDHLLYKIYASSLSSGELSALKAEHYNDIVYCGVTRLWQGVDITAYLAELQS